MGLDRDFIEQRSRDRRDQNERRPPMCAKEIVLASGERLAPHWDARVFISKDRSKIWLEEGGKWRVALSRKEALGLLQALQNELVLDALADLEDPS